MRRTVRPATSLRRPRGHSRRSSTLPSSATTTVQEWPARKGERPAFANTAGSASSGTSNVQPARRTRAVIDPPLDAEPRGKARSGSIDSVTSRALPSEARARRCDSAAASSCMLSSRRSLRRSRPATSSPSGNPSVMPGGSDTSSPSPAPAGRNTSASAPSTVMRTRTVRCSPPPRDHHAFVTVARHRMSASNSANRSRSSRRSARSSAARMRWGNASPASTPWPNRRRTRGMTTSSRRSRYSAGCRRIRFPATRFRIFPRNQCRSRRSRSAPGSVWASTMSSTASRCGKYVSGSMRDELALPGCLTQA